MKTMTCTQLGGPCDHAHHGESADDVINAQDQHLKDMVAAGDTAHEPALADMKGRWKRPDLRHEVVQDREEGLRRAPRGRDGELTPASQCRSGSARSNSMWSSRRPRNM